MANITRIQSLCAEYLGGIWEQFCNEIEVTTIETGFANMTYRCSLDKSEQKDVIFKLFGSELTANNSLKLQGITGEMVIFYQLSLNGIAPKLFAAFDEGRIEEFIKGRNVTNEDFLSNPLLLSSLAKIMVDYHSQSMPVSKQIKFFDKIVKPFSAIELDIPIEEFRESERIHVKNLFDFPIKQEIEWFMKFEPKINSKIVFSHHDIRSDNIILRELCKKNEEPLVLIDYELSGYNYRGFDIAYFLLNLCYRISKTKETIRCELERNLKPEIEKQFLEEYLKHLQSKHNVNKEFDNFDHLLMETKYFHFLVNLVSMGYDRGLVKTPTWSKKMESFAYITQMINDYKEKKNTFIASYSNIFD